MLWLLLMLASMQTGVSALQTTSDPSISYVYYLPSGYTPAKQWPVVFVFDPGRRGALAAELFREPAETYGWIVVSSNNTSSSDDWPPNAKAINATTADARQRFAIDPKRVYAAGMSGGAIMAWTLAQSSGAVAGVIGCSGRLSDNQTANIRFDWFGTAGLADFNYTETRAIESALAAAHARYRVEVFDGGHEWPPKELIGQAVEWMELQAMRRGTKPRDDAFVARMLQQDLAAADALAQGGRELDAMRRYDAIARTFDGLTDVYAARKKADELRDRPPVKHAEKQERRGDAFEASAKRRMSAAIQTFINDDAEPGAALLRDLDAAHLRKIASGSDYDAAVARRVLSLVRYQLRMLAHDLDAHQRGTRAETVRSVLALLQP
jgi:predicted esterase